MLFAAVNMTSAESIVLFFRNSLPAFTKDAQARYRCLSVSALHAGVIFSTLVKAESVPIRSPCWR